MTVHVPPQLPVNMRPPIKLAFIGEAPSDEEIEHGIPLVGPSGRQFNALLRSAGIVRSECLVTNVFDEQLPGNDVRAFCVPAKDARSLGATALPSIGKAGVLAPVHYHHLDRLREELETWNPNVIVPLGGTALWALTGSASITAMRGTVNAASLLVPGKKLIPTFHPATLFHSFKYWSVIIGDLERARLEADRGPEIVHARRELLLAPTLLDLDSSYARLVSTSLLAVDIETGWGQLTCIGFSPDPEFALCVPFFDNRQLTRSYWNSPLDELQAWRFVQKVMSHEVPKVGQNFGAYDAFWLLDKYHIAARNFREDTRLLHHSLHPELEKSLEFMGNSYANQGAWKFWGRRAKRDD